MPCILNLDSIARIRSLFLPEQMLPNGIAIDSSERHIIYRKGLSRNRNRTKFTVCWDRF